ncbi:LysR substrate-binding domain-containing protein [Bradyrhizobium sp. RDM4]|uniref:LysR substrate-binding domain-containing protein n=1 Tax=Bradyrhizobium sp. RDM4 TaxID=3378765 RepID=UPI0038FD3AB7
MAELTEAHPALQIDLDLSDRYLGLQSSGVDLAIGLSDDAPSGWMSVDLGAVPVRLCASPAYMFALRPSHLLRAARVRVIVEALQKRLGRPACRMG